MAARKKAAAKKNGGALVIGGGSAPMLASDAGAALMAKYRGSASVAPVSTIAATGLPWITIQKTGALKAGDRALGNEIEVVVIDWFYDRRLYTKAFDEQNPSGAACFALGRELPTLVAPEPSQSATCATCQWDVFGTEPQRGKAKACGEHVRLAVVQASFIREGVAATAVPIHLIKVPVTSVKRWLEYMNALAVLVGDYAPIGAVTRITGSGEPHQSLHFEPCDDLVPFETAQALQQVAIDRSKDIWQPPSRESAESAGDVKPSRKGARRTVSA